MKRSELERHLRASGCRLEREGAKHAIWKNPMNGATSAVPRHAEVKRNTARRICIDLAILRPPGL
ncbi:MAG: type II toxin-antitoxin system HicA family toxin [Fimbriimonadaceae bacterium]|nr:type II toxin-antitoxin system HicA family toxin [Fimbriimonadaceae bacterium]